MPSLEQTWRWFGPRDSITLNDIRQTGATGIVTALHHLPNGEVWTSEEISTRKKEIEANGLRWSVVESVPVHEEIKIGDGESQRWIENYKTTVRNLGRAGVRVICYNFMPVLDWTRTDLSWRLEDGSTALRYDASLIHAFDLFLLKRPQARDALSREEFETARERFGSLSENDRNELVRTILAGLPGSEEGYSLNRFREMLERYSATDEQRLRENLYHFLEQVVPVAEEEGVRLAIHPDDPPRPLFGLPRVVSTRKDIEQLYQAVDSPANGLTFCSGSFGVREDNDLPDMIRRFGSRIHFVHFRSVRREPDGSFYEANHLEGDAGMAQLMKALIEEQARREQAGRSDLEIPVRPDHGHAMLGDQDRNTQPGYTLFGRMRGLAELRGLEAGLRACGK